MATYNKEDNIKWNDLSTSLQDIIMRKITWNMLHPDLQSWLLDKERRIIELERWRRTKADPMLDDHERRLSDLEDDIDDINIKITGLIKTVNDSVQMKAFQYGLEFLGWGNSSITVPIPPGYTVNQCIFIIMHGAPGSYGVQNLRYSVKMGDNRFIDIESHKHALVLCNKGWNF